MNDSSYHCHSQESDSYDNWYAGEPFWRRLTPEETRQAVEPLVERLDGVQQVLRKLKTIGGYIADLNKVTALLRHPIVLNTPSGSQTISLINPEGVSRVLKQVNWDLKLQVRQLPNRMPAYYIGRTRQDWWAEYSLVVEDIYQSPDFPVQDERFYRLMHAGHEMYYLRVAQFREAAAEYMALKHPDNPMTTDHLLYSAGRNVFQHAWHEDQRLAFLVARNFGLEDFKRAIELLYLCLGADLCELRSAVTPVMLGFFETVYPQPAIRRALAEICAMDGQQLNHLPRLAIQVYQKLSKAFGGFLKTELAWGDTNKELPLWNLIYANLGRLETISPRLMNTTSVGQACFNLEEESRIFVKMMFES